MKWHTVRAACIATYSTAEPTVSAGAPAVGVAVHYGAVSLFTENRREAARRLRRIVLINGLSLRHPKRSFSGVTQRFSILHRTK